MTQDPRQLREVNRVTGGTRVFRSYLVPLPPSVPSFRRDRRSEDEWNVRNERTGHESTTRGNDEEREEVKRKRPLQPLSRVTLSRTGGATHRSSLTSLVTRFVVPPSTPLVPLGERARGTYGTGVARESGGKRRVT